MDLIEKQKKLLIFTAKSLHKAGLETQALTAFKSAIDMDAQLSPKHLELFFSLVRSILNPMRTSLKLLQECEIREIREKHRHIVRDIQKYQPKHFQEFEMSVHDILSIIGQQLIPVATNVENKIDLIRLEGDLYRYLLEFAPKDKHDFYLIRCEAVYTEALKTSMKQLPPFSTVRLSVTLNYSIFTAEHLHKPGDAIEFAEAEVNRLVSANSELSEATYQKAMYFARKLREKVIQWKS